MKILFPFWIVLFLFSLSVSADVGMPRSLFSVTGEPPVGFAGKGEAGLSLIGGNTESNRVSLAAQTSYRFEVETIQFATQFLKADADGVPNANQWSLGLRYERRLIHRLGGFIGQSVEGDRFAGYRQRYGSDIGLRRTLWAGEKSVAALELGYRYRLEHRFSAPTERGHIVRVFAETSYRFTPTFLGVASVEGLPDVSKGDAWMVNSDLSVQSEITGTIALKSGYAYRYNHRPAGPKRYDSALTTSVIAKF